MSGSKSERCLELEKDSLAEILSIDNIVKRSEKALGMSGATKLSECMPKLSKIARKEGLNLNNTKEFKKAVGLLKDKK